MQELHRRILSHLSETTRKLTISEIVNELWLSHYPHNVLADLQRQGCIFNVIEEGVQYGITKGGKYVLHHLLSPENGNPEIPRTNRLATQRPETKTKRTRARRRY